MLTIIIDETEMFDEVKQEFSYGEEVVLELEHSLISVSKWESKHKKPFLSSTGERTVEEMLSYIWCMIMTPDVDPEVMKRFDMKALDAVQQYIESSESATTFGEMPKSPGPSEIITAELIYYWLVAFTIPFECENWHLNRLFALIRICNIKNSPPQKMSAREIAMRNREINEQRKKDLGTRG